MKAQPWAVALGCFVAGSLAAAGIASATSAPMKIPDSTTGVITACMVKKTGAVRFINAQAGKTCKKKEKKITFNKTGPQGEQGVQGERGPSNAYVATRTTEKGIAQLMMDPNFNDILTLNLPAGQYVVSANTSAAATNNDTGQIRCRLDAATGLASTPATWELVPPAQVDKQQPFAMTGTLTATADTTLTLICAPSDLTVGAPFGAGTVYGATMTATRVAELTGP